MGAMHLLNTLQGQLGENMKRKPYKVWSNELMYMDIKFNGQTMHIMEEYVRTCLTYHQDKVEQQKPMRLLEPLLIY